MKTIEYYMNLPYRLELVPDTDEGGFVASYPELSGCLTSGETAEAALKNALDCKREWLAAALEDGYEIPEPTSDDEYSGQFKLRLPEVAAPRTCGKLQTRGYQHEPVLSVPADKKQR